MKAGAYFVPLLALFSGAGSQSPSPMASSLPYYEVRYEPSGVAGELIFPVTYRLWLPPYVKTLRGVVVHQHGCGEGAYKGGETAADDLHWQALARRWDCALLGPSYQQPDTANCALWCDPSNGSGKTFLRALEELGQQSSHPELARVPWALWGHSGGATWVGTMMILYPERVVGVWLRSGAPGLLPVQNDAKLEIPPAVYGVPMLCNPGVKEQEGRFARVWTKSVAFFREVRAKGGLIGIAPDPRTSHECGDSRYLAIPFLNACLAQRLPKRAGSAALHAMPTGVTKPSPLSDDANVTVWLPNETVANAWAEYVRTGATTDPTPPPSPTNVRVTQTGQLSWEAEADFESGLAGFIIECDGVELVQLPQQPAGPFGRPLFQTMSFHDTPTRPLPAMRFTDPDAKVGSTRVYRLLAVNSVGLKSAKVKAIRVSTLR